MREHYMQNTYLAKLGAGDDLSEHLQLSRVYYINQDYPRAHDELVAIPTERRDAATWNNLGNVQLAVGEVDAALASYATARGMDAQDPGIALNRGLALHLAGDRDQGQSELAAAVVGAQGVDGAMHLLGARASHTEPTSKAGEDVALEQLSLQAIEELLRLASGQVPRAASVDSTQATSVPDSIESAQMGAGAAKTATTGNQQQAPGRAVPTLAGGSRGSEIATSNVADILYWKRN
jgi:Flp pilus assembly protein TadD